jgi:hypothetical protein
VQTGENVTIGIRSSGELDEEGGKYVMVVLVKVMGADD